MARCTGALANSERMKASNRLSIGIAHGVLCRADSTFPTMYARLGILGRIRGENDILTLETMPAYVNTVLLGHSIPPCNICKFFASPLTFARIPAMLKWQGAYGSSGPPAQITTHCADSTR
jgi:hypothetical protein